MKTNLPLMDFILLILRNKKQLLINGFIVGIISIGVSLLLTKWYKADCLFSIPESKSAPGLESIISDLPFDFGYSVEQKGEKFITLLESRQVVDALIDSFSIDEDFDFEYRFQLRRFILESIISHEINKDETIRVTVVYPDDKEKPARMANFLIRKIDDLHKRLNSQQAHFQRVFLEEQYAKIKSDLNNLEDTLASFQQKYGVFDISEQFKGSIDLISKLQFERIQTDIAIKVQRKYISEETPEISRLLLKRATLDEKINNLISESDQLKLFKPLKEVPEISLTYVRLMRDITIKEKILEFLIPQLERAKIEEVKNTPSIQVIDPAIPAEYKYKPKRALVVIGVVSLALLLHVGYLLISAYVSNRKSHDESFSNRLKEIRQLIKFK